MAIYRSTTGNTLVHDDDKLGFDDWIFDDEARLEQWRVAATAHQAWQEANPDAHPADANDDANAIFEEWVAYANAKPTA